MISSRGSTTVSFFIEVSASLLWARATHMRETFSTDSSGRLVTTVLAVWTALRAIKGLSAIGTSLCCVSFLSFRSMRRKILSLGWIVSEFVRKILSKLFLYHYRAFFNLFFIYEITFPSHFFYLCLSLSVHLYLVGRRESVIDQGGLDSTRWKGELTWKYEVGNYTRMSGPKCRGFSPWGGHWCTHAAQRGWLG